MDANKKGRTHLGFPNAKKAVAKEMHTEKEGRRRERKRESKSNYPGEVK